MKTLSIPQEVTDTGISMPNILSGAAAYGTCGRLFSDGNHITVFFVSTGTAVSPQTIASFAAPREVIERELQRLADQWYRETGKYSLDTDVILHPAYLRIIGLGQQAIPFILRQLESRGGQWYQALESITGENPIQAEDAGKISRMKAAWLNWGRAHGYIS
jgi:hypothetical protein